MVKLQDLLKKAQTVRLILNSSKVIFSRSFEYIFDADFILQSGKETEGLTTTTYGKDWVVEKVKTNTKDLPEIGDNTTGIPTSLLDKDDTSKTKILVQTFGEGESSQTTYFDQSGNIFRLLKVPTNFLMELLKYYMKIKIMKI